MPGVFRRRKVFEDTEEEWERRPYEDGGRNWNYVATSQDLPQITSIHQELEDARKDSFLETLKGSRPYRHLDFRILASRTVRGYISLV